MANTSNMQNVKISIAEELAAIEEIIYKLVNLNDVESRVEYAEAAITQIDSIKNKNKA